MIKAVIFDLGGTLIDYAGEHATWPELEIPGMSAAYSTLGEQGVSLPGLNHFQSIGFQRLPERWQQATMGGPNLTIDSLLGDILETAEFALPPTAVLQAAARQYEAAMCQAALPIPNGRDTLTQLKEEGYQIGLISNTMFAGTSHINDLERFGLVDFFDIMLFSADVNKWKPTTAPFQHVLETLGVEATNAVYVGDDPAADVVGGQATGMKTVYFPSSDRFAPVHGIHPDATINSLRELPDCLVTLNRA